jgi:hypothetical protein
MCIIGKKTPEIIILAFIYIYLKKNARINDFGIFICKMKKNTETIIPAFYM